MTGIVVLGFALMAIGGLGGFLLATLARPSGASRSEGRPLPRSSSRRGPSPARAVPVGVVVEEESEEESPPTLSPQQPVQPLRVNSLAMMALPDYNPADENEDDVPTALYRHQDEDLEALLAEMDTGQHQR